MDEKFETVWQALVEHGSSQRNREAVKQYWDTLTREQQDRAYKNIPRKVREDKFVQYDPIRAIRENIRAYLLPEPEDLNRTSKYKTLEPATPLVSASYHDVFGIYTLAQALEYGMYIKGGMNFDWETYRIARMHDPDYQPVIIIRD